MREDQEPELPSAHVGQSADTAIAIVGLGALYPRSGNVREFWTNVIGGVDCIEDVPETHWRVDDYYSARRVNRRGAVDVESQCATAAPASRETESTLQLSSATLNGASEDDFHRCR